MEKGTKIMIVLVIIIAIVIGIVYYYKRVQDYIKLYPTDNPMPGISGDFYDHIQKKIQRGHWLGDTRAGVEGQLLYFKNEGRISPAQFTEAQRLLDELYV